MFDQYLRFEWTTVRKIDVNTAYRHSFENTTKEHVFLFSKWNEPYIRLQDKMSNDTIQYSDKYNDDKFEYRHVILPADIAKLVPKSHLMTETEWRNLGVQQSPGWVHYMMHGPEPHVLLFRRPRVSMTAPIVRNGTVPLESQN